MLRFLVFFSSLCLFSGFAYSMDTINISTKWFECNRTHIQVIKNFTADYALPYELGQKLLGLNVELGIDEIQKEMLRFEKPLRELNKPSRLEIHGGKEISLLDVMMLCPTQRKSLLRVERSIEKVFVFIDLYNSDKNKIKLGHSYFVTQDEYQDIRNLPPALLGKIGPTASVLVEGAGCFGRHKAKPLCNNGGYFGWFFG